MESEVKRGDIYLADLSPVVGSEQGGTRPVLVIQNDIGNQHSTTVIVAAITAKIQKPKLPTHVECNARENNLKYDSVILLEQLRTIDKQRLQHKISHINDQLQADVDEALEVSLELKKILTM